LQLNDPVSGLVDWNLVPVESIHRLQIWDQPGEEAPGWLSPGYSLQVISRDLAGAGLRSATGYRVGANGYDDVDVRAGLKPTQTTALNAGGILKNYSGTAAEEKYRAQKINLKLERKIGSSARLSYLMLLNKMDRDVPWTEETWPQVATMHEKLNRYDHGLAVQISGLRVLWQYTDVYREFYNYQRSGIQQIQDAARSRLLVQEAGKLAGLNWRSGGVWQFAKMDIRGQSRRQRHDGEIWAEIGSTDQARWYWSAGVNALNKAKQRSKFCPGCNWSAASAAPG